MLNKLRPAIFVLATLLAFSAVTAGAEDRTAGSVPIAGKKIPAAQKNTGQQNRTIPAVGKAGYISKVNFSTLESRGLLTSVTNGSLGADIWQNTKRSDLVSLLEEMPPTSQYKTLQRLTRRLLLTQADTSLLNKDTPPEPGKDILTLRIQKLMEMGNFKEAAELYGKNPYEPYHENYARAGILSMMYSRQTALACLETKVVEQYFQDDVFWQQISKICTHILSQLGNVKDLPENEDLTIPDSKILQRIVEKDTYRFKAHRPEDLKNLTQLEAAVLFGLDRLDLSSLKIKEPASLPPHVLAMFISAPNLQITQRLDLMIEATSLGVKSADDLGAFYEELAQTFLGDKKTSLALGDKKTSLAEFKTIEGWQRLPYLFKAAGEAAKGEERGVILEKALALKNDYKLSALYPFANLMADTDPGNLPPDTLDSALEIMTDTGTRIPDSWFKAWLAKGDHAEKPTEQAFLAYLAYALDSNKSVNLLLQHVDFQENFDSLGEHERQVIHIIYEKLDTSVKLLNDGSSVNYDKQPGLTFANDYVMPSIGLLDSLKLAESDTRLGEVILISSVALREASPDKTNTGVFSGVIDGFLTVGLTQEARDLAQEVILGLKEK